MRISAKLLGKTLASVSDDTLRQVYEESRFTIEQIAKQLKCSGAEVSRRLHRAGANMRSATDYKAPPKEYVNVRDLEK